MGRFLPEGSYTLLGIQVVGEGADTTRELVTAAALDLLSQYGLQGMGYMNFMEFLGLQTGYSDTRLGYAFFGTNLHNSYLTWLLEGGALVSSVVMILFLRTWKRMRWVLRYERNFGILALSWAGASALLAAFHQLHGMMQFWGSIGMIFGVYSRSYARSNVAMASAK
jgi:O-antigen ligase